MVTRWLGAALSGLVFAFATPGLGPRRVARAAEKPETWVEVRSPHFIVASNGGEKHARRIAEQFEQVRAVFQKALNNIRVDPGQPIIILAAKNEKTLKALLPEFWERKGSRHPAGMFVPGHEKHYVVLRLDAEGDNPYHVIYHEYVHMLAHLNFSRLPVWLDEGHAEFLGNATIGPNEARIGQPSPSAVLQLRDTKLIPLEILFKVSHDSPYYNEAEKTSIFYAQSWALVHYFMLDKQLSKTNPLGKFLGLVENDVDEIEAARRAFGDLKTLQQKIESYVRQSTFFEFVVKTSTEVNDKDFLARTLSPAETAALLGDFHLHRRRTNEARALLEEALRLDPNLGLANESVGFLHHQLGDRQEAATWFARAVKLDSRSYLAHYFHALLMVEGAPQPESFAEAEASLRRATELRPNFAPAYAALATLYSIRQETLEHALAAARKAAELEPGDPRYYLTYGQVLLRLQRVEDARVVGQRFLAAAKSPEIRTLAESLLQEIARYEDYLAQRKHSEEEVRASRAQLAADLRNEEEAKTSETPQPPSKTSHVPPGAVGPTSARRYSAFGTITQLSCARPPALELTLNLGAMVIRLHAANFSKVDYLTTTWKPPANFNPCAHLNGRSAQVSYTLVQGQPYDGEIVSVEIRK